MKTKTVEARYPDARARRAADEAIDGLSVDDSMLKYIVVWEAAYLEAGGKVVL